ncbi:MAG TPA: hypothetical protein DEQ43_24655 [Nocardioides bacterium]|nr:hypothetical protein [Nocardioides sp.]
MMAYDQHLADAEDVINAAIAAVHALEHDALRWEDPIGPHVYLLRQIRAALGIDDGHYGDGCALCRDAGDRWYRHHGTRPDWTTRTRPEAAS